MDQLWSLVNPISAGLLPAANYTTSGLLLLIVVLLITLIYNHYKNVYSYWANKGLNGPRPTLVVGNMLENLFGKRMKIETDWSIKYGKVYGVYHGRSPRLVIADAEMLRQICIKDFDVFPNHEANEFFTQYQRNFLIFLQDDHWKKVRAMMSPTFTSGKIKKMFKLLDACADDLVDCFQRQLATQQATINKKQQQESGQAVVVNLKELFGMYTMDAIATCCYGLKLQHRGSNNVKTVASRDDFVAMAMRLFEFNVYRIFSTFIVPKPLLRLFGFRLTSRGVFEPLAKRVGQLIKARRDTKKKFDDYLQLLIDAKLSDEMELNDMDLKENHHAGLTHESLLADQKRMVEQVESMQASANDMSQDKQAVELSELEIMAGAMFLLVVGMETTATLLTHCIYSLAHHQDIQQRLYEEIRSMVEYNEDKTKHTFDYDVLTSNQYLDAVVSETLRILPPVLQIDRVSAQDYRIDKYNLEIPKGSKLVLSYYAILNDPDYWPNPRKFDPERFMPANKDKIVPGSYCPFGLGPRHCLGMRFSLIETRLALAKVLMRFRFEPAPDSKYPPEAALTFGLNRLKSPIARLLPRAD